MAEGLSSFEEHNILELLLFYGICRKDTNPIAHELMNRFGSLEAVLEASPEQLMQVPDVGECAAVLVKLVQSLAIRYAGSLCSEMQGKPYDHKATGEYLQRRYAFCETEEVYALFYDDALLCIGEGVLHRGSIHSTAFNFRELVDILTRNHACYVVAAHNHPGGTPIASSDDLNVSHRLREFLSNMGITLLEHYILGKELFTGTEHRA